MKNWKALGFSALATLTVLSAAPAFAAPTNAANNTATSNELTPAEVHALPDGGTEYVYYIGGVKNSFPVPPAHFSPMTASDAQLTEYGFPARPTNAAKLQEWKQLMGSWKATAAPKVVLGTNYHKLTPSNNVSGLPTSITNSASSSNWAGYYTNTSYNRWVAVEGDFTQPTEGSNTYSNAYESSWVGLGGVNSGNLIQDGTQMANYSYNAWYEYLSATAGSVPEINLPNVSVSPGQHIHTYVYYNTSNGVATFYVQNTSNGTSQQVNVSLGSAYFDGSTAEWIDERPTLGSGSLAALANFGHNYWTAAQAYDTGWAGIGSLPYDSIAMYNGSDLLAAPNGLSSSTSFTENWYANL